MGRSSAFSCATKSHEKKTAHASEQDRPELVKQRADWKAAQAGLEAERLVFVDETSTSTKMARLWGRCPRGQRLRVGVPHGHWKTTSFVAGFTLRGFIAPWVLDGPFDRAAFEAWLEKALIPELREGDIVVMDNLSSHKGPRVRELIEGAKARLLYLPPYSPDCNPIENAFSKLKSLLRKAAARTRETLEQAIAQAIDAFSAQDCANIFRSHQYDKIR